MRLQDGLLCPLTVTLALLMSGCPGDDGSPMDTDTDTEGATGTTDDTDPTNTNPTASTSSSGSDSSSSTTESADDTTTTGPDDTTGDPPPEGVCLGLDVVGAVATVFSMGGGPPVGPCDPTPAPCGGDVVGTWNVEASCGYDAVPNPLEDQCPGSTFQLNVLGQSGSATFEMDGTFTQDFNVEVEAVFTLDVMACIGVGCAEFEAAIQMDDPGATCMDDMGMCTCTFPPEPPAPPVMGTYEVMGDQLILDVDGEITELDYCAENGRLDTWSPVLDVVPTETLCDVDQDCYDELGKTHDAYFCALPEEEMQTVGERLRSW